MTFVVQANEIAELRGYIPAVPLDGNTPSEARKVAPPYPNRAKTVMDYR
jgi:hypothetical protein